MPLVGFEPTIPAFERAETVHALDCDRHMLVVYVSYVYDDEEISDVSGTCSTLRATDIQSTGGTSMPP
jgi:hypothetical protein